MDREAQGQPEAPVQVYLSLPRGTSTGTYVDPDAQAEPQAQSEQPQQETNEDFDDSDIESAVLNYLSERLGRDISDFDALSAPQPSALDERVEAIAKLFPRQEEPRRLVLIPAIESSRDG